MEIKEAIKIINQYDMNFHWNDGEPIPAEQLAEAFDLAISALEKQEQDRWIPVTERLPEYGTAVLTQLSDNDIVVNWVTDEEDEKWFEYGVVAWKPLPEPYTEEEA